MISRKAIDISSMLQISKGFEVPRDPMEDFYSAISCDNRSLCENDNAPIKSNRKPNSTSYKRTVELTLPHSTITSMDFHRDSIKIASNEDTVFLDVWFYKPSGTAPYPLIVAGHGMTVIKEAGLAAFGQRWATDAGYASLIFDYRGFGASDGQPRNLVSLEKQLEDYKSVIQWARQRPELFRNDKIVVMGSALSGLHVATLALEDSALAGGMAHCPMLDGYATLNSLGFKPRLVLWAIADVIRSKLGLSPLFVRAIGRPNEFSILNTPSSFPGFISMYSQGPIPFSSAPNLIAPRVAFEIMSARPGLRLKDAHCPLLIVISEDDDIMPAAIGRNIASGALDKVTIVEAPGGHYDIMEGGQGFDVNINAQIDFLRIILSSSEQSEFQAPTTSSF